LVRYDRTTVNDVIEKAEVTKGGFCHHFASKKKMLEASPLGSHRNPSAGLNTSFEPGLDALALGS
jgi:hypothetical protein